jgi:hypothetical protein
VARGYRTGSAAHLRALDLPEADGASDWRQTLLPDGARAVVALSTWETIRDGRYRRPEWLLFFRVLEPATHAGQTLAAWMNIPGDGVPYNSKLWAWWTAVTHLRPPRDLVRRGPGYFLEECHLDVSTRVPRKNDRQRPRPPELGYSTIDEVLGVVGGSPPALQERTHGRSPARGRGAAPRRALPSQHHPGAAHRRDEETECENDR